MKTLTIFATVLVIGFACWFNLRLSSCPQVGNVHSLSILAGQDDTETITKVESSTQPDLATELRPHNAKLERLLRDSRRPATFARPNRDEIEKFETLLRGTIRQSTPPDSLVQAWKVEGWQIHQWNANGDSFLAVSETDDQRRGRGFYAFRIDSESKLVLQAPHRFYDSGSGTIVRKLFDENDCSAAAWNTVHRKKFDLAHQEHHYLNAFTRVMIAIEPESIVAQLHGFANEKQSGSARTAELIVSDATRYPGRLARSTAVRFKQGFGVEAVRLYPLDVKRLGGTKNAQATVVREQGSTGFLHLELNRDLRKRLLNSFDLRSAFYKSLADPS